MLASSTVTASRMHHNMTSEIGGLANVRSWTAAKKCRPNKIPKKEN